MYDILTCTEAAEVKTKQRVSYSHVSICLIPPVFKWLTYGQECENLALLCICVCLSVSVHAVSPVAPCWVCVIIQQGLL